MLWPQLTEAVSSVASDVRGILPWILLASGVLLQTIGVLSLVRRHGQGIDVAALPEIRSPAKSCDRVVPVEGSVDLMVPVAGARVPSDPELLPGARRAYRGGEHEGVDFSCRPNATVVAAADGWVLSIDDEPDLPEPRRDEILDYARTLGRTPSEVLHVLYGRRVVLCHGLRGGKLVTTSYAHLQQVRSDLRPGDRVKRGEPIGTAGGSGTSHAYQGGKWTELHFEIRLNGEPLGLGLAPSAAGALYRSLLTEGPQ
jgi:murein DD-endopeptidase MepM/ murein hydrolase activator NlpD